MSYPLSMICRRTEPPRNPTTEEYLARSYVIAAAFIWTCDVLARCFKSVNAKVTANVVIVRFIRFPFLVGEKSIERVCDQCRTLSWHISAQRCVGTSDFLQRGSEHRFVRSLLARAGIHTASAASANNSPDVQRIAIGYVT